MRRNDKETLSAQLALCERNPSVTGAFMFSLLLNMLSLFVGGLRHHGAQVTALISRGLFTLYHDHCSLIYRAALFYAHHAQADHYSDVTMGALASQITSNSTVYLTICSDLHQRNIITPRHWPFGRGIHRWPVNSPHKGPVTRKKLPFDDVIMSGQIWWWEYNIFVNMIRILFGKHVPCENFNPY